MLKSCVIDKKRDAMGLQMLRKQFCKTQNEFARKLNIARSTLSNYEGGRRNIPEDIVHRVENIVRESA